MKKKIQKKTQTTTTNHQQSNKLLQMRKMLYFGCDYSQILEYLVYTQRTKHAENARK